jgi:hypothetical protein
MVTLGWSLVAGCAVLPRQLRPTKVARIGVLSQAGPTTGAGLVENCRQGLGELGYVEGRDYTFEARYAEDDDRTHGWHPYGLQSVLSC